MKRQHRYFWRGGVIVFLHSFAVFSGCHENSKQHLNTTSAQIVSGSKQLRILLSEMLSPDDKTKTDAIERALTYTVLPFDTCLIPQMTDMLQHDDSGVQLAILSILGKLGKNATEALPAVRACLNSHDKVVRGWAQETIDDIENPETNNTKEDTDPVGPATESVPAM